MEVIKFLGLLSLVWLFAEGAEPPQFFKRFLNIGNDSNPKDTLRLLFRALLNCCLCLGFWVGLIIYKDLYMAGLVSIGSEGLSRLLKKIFI